MTETACPSCDAPAAPGARRCASCGYRFVEDVGAAPRPRIGRRALGIGATALAAAAAVLATIVLIGGDGDDTVARGAPGGHLPVLAEHPLSRLSLERILEERLLPVPDDDESDVHCSGRIAKPAHSVRRCYVTYPGGTRNRVSVLTTARGTEVLSRP
jgi:hypothetical protein